LRGLETKRFRRRRRIRKKHWQGKKLRILSNPDSRLILKFWKLKQNLFHFILNLLSFFKILKHPLTKGSEKICIITCAIQAWDKVQDSLFVWLHKHRFDTQHLSAPGFFVCLGIFGVKCGDTLIRWIWGGGRGGLAQSGN
jgi:hypothetical protein